MNPTKRKLARRAAATRGMTLIEILVVLAIIGLIMGGVAVVAVNAMNDARIDTARNDMGNLAQSVEMYQLQKKGKCPKTVQDLKAAGVIKKANQDPWGGEYTLKCPGEHDAVDISSAGPDGQAGNEDDIHSWDAEQADAGAEEKE
jgi:general secretion pathway protein G